MITVVFIATCGMLLLSSTVCETCLSRNSEVHRLKRNKAWHLDQLKVPAAWNHGFTGKGVVVSTVDDGIQMNHPALAPNYDPLASSNTLENNNDPSPSEDDHSHGTMCAGLVASVADNEISGKGVAYSAAIGGIRVAVDTMGNANNDVTEARALSFNPNHIDIYSCSWGPKDDGKTLEGPGPLAMQALLNGTTSGRRGLGSIYVFATGNGGDNFDSCSCDGYASSVYTMSITAATKSGLKPFYTEECSSTLAATPSSGNNELDGIIATTTVDASLRPEHLYTTEFTGTSASAALASGVSALALEANRNLTWRDLQYLVVVSSNPKPLLLEPGWSMNGVGRQFSHKFGYGLMDADKMVRMAQSWKTLPPQHICATPTMLTNTLLPDDLGRGVNVSMKTNACFGTTQAIHYLEHVQCKITLKFYPRGNVLIALSSPAGTRSVLLLPRSLDTDATSFEDWPFLSVHFWGERPEGMWTLEVLNMGQQPRYWADMAGQGELIKWQLLFYGTGEKPVLPIHA